MAFEINAEEIVETATSKESFNVFDFIQGAKLPEHSIVVYTDADAALKTARLLIEESARLKAAEGEVYGLDEVGVELADEDELAELNERLVSSGLTFHMRGLAPAAVKALDLHIRATSDYKEGAENVEYNKLFNHTLISKSILGVTSHDGAAANNNWTPGAVETLLESLYSSEADKLFQTAAELSYVGAIFDRAVSADFS